MRALRRRDRAAGQGARRTGRSPRRSGASPRRATTSARRRRAPRRPADLAGADRPPTEARRRTVLLALRRIYALLDELDDARLTPAGDAEIRRRLREEITVLWRTADLRAERPTPLDEVRSAMVFFDATLFTATPRLYRALDAALDRLARRAARTARPPPTPGGPGPGRPRVPAFLRWGSWIGGDRDGHPYVTAETTLEALRIQADHVLHGVRRGGDRG